MSRASLGFRLALAAAALGTPLTTARAQEPTDRARLRILRDSLAFSHDSLSLLALEAQTIEFAKVHRDDPLIHLRLGFLAIRLGELGHGAKHFDDAAGEFEWAAELRQDWPYPWYGLGLAEAGMPNRAHGFAGGLWTMLSIDRDSRAGKAFAKAVDVDPSFTEGILSFSQIAREQRIDAPIKIALDAMRTATALPSGWSPELLLERGRLERVAGHPDSARVAFEHAILLGVKNDVAYAELARTLPLTGDTVAASPGEPTPVELDYYAGAASDDPEVVAMYRHDLKPMVSDSVLTVFDALTGAARVPWLREFWGIRAAADLRTAGSRLAEHFRRWDFALQHFRLPPFRRVYDWGIEIYKSGDEDIDDRGVVWLRQGEPSIRIVWPRGQTRGTVARSPRYDFVDPAMPANALPGSLFIDKNPGDAASYGNETWRYIRPEGDMVLNFIARNPDDYHMVESIAQLDVGYGAIQHRAKDLPGVMRLIGSGRISRMGFEEEMRQTGRKAITAATTTDRWARDYPVIMGGRALWLSAGQQNGTPLVHIVYSVDAAMLRTLPVRQDGKIPLEVRATFFGALGGPLATLDTVQMIPRPDSGLKYVAMRAQVPVPPGSHKMRLGVEASPDVGAVYALDSILVPDPRSDTLSLSSLLIGVHGRSLPWAVTPADSVWLDATNAFVAGDTLGVYFETYGVHPGTPYTVHLAVTREHGAIGNLLKGHKDAITLTERVTFTDSRGKFQRGIDLAGLEAGTYSLQVTVDGGGRRIVRRRVLTVRERGP